MRKEIVISVVFIQIEQDFRQYFFIAGNNACLLFNNSCHNVEDLTGQKNNRTI